MGAVPGGAVLAPSRPSPGSEGSSGAVQWECFRREAVHVGRGTRGAPDLPSLPRAVRLPPS